MNVEDLEGYYGSRAKAQEALGLKSRQTLSNWSRDGIPGGEQCRIELLTADKLGVNGHPPLKADESAVKKVA
jgi:hypothetical protein